MGKSARCHPDRRNFAFGLCRDCASIGGRDGRAPRAREALRAIETLADELPDEPDRHDTPRAAASAPKKATRRECLRCDLPFPSEGVHNRLCDPCREVNAEMFEPAGAYVGDYAINPEEQVA